MSMDLQVNVDVADNGRVWPVDVDEDAERLQYMAFSRSVVSPAPLS